MTRIDFPATTEFTSVTVILPVVNETISLAQTADIILRDVARPLLREILVIVCKKTTSASMRVINELQKQHGDLVVVHDQTLPFLGGAMREAFDLARGSHVIMMASDMETDPNDVKILIRESQKIPGGIVTASRWLHGVDFHGYSKIKLLCNWFFQKIFSALYGAKVTDMTYAYRIFPTKLVQSIEWEDLRHSFLFETLVKPLRLDVEVVEIPSVWRARAEGESQNTFWRNFEYFKIGLRTRFMPRKSILRSKT